MLVKMFLFEWRYFTRQPSFYICLAVFFALTFLAISLNQVGMTGAGYVFKNGPYLTAFLLIFLSIFSMFIVVNFVASAALRDHTSGMAELVFSRPINPINYQLGRFFGAFSIALCVFAAAPFGALLGSLMPWVEPARFGPTHWQYYTSAFLYLSLPTLFVFACLFYAFAIRFRTMFAVYLSVVAVIVCYEISDSLFVTPELRQFGSLLDPFAFRTFTEITRYWSILEKNTQTLTLTGPLLMNRLIWVGLGVFILLFFGRFSHSLRVQKKTVKAPSLNNNDRPDRHHFKLNKLTAYRGNKNSGRQQFITRVKFEIRQVIADPGFRILGGFTFVALLGIMAEPKGFFGAVNWPVTQDMIGFIRSTVGLLSLAVITYYSAEVIYRERSAKIDTLIDSMPVANWVLGLSKLVALWLVIISLLVFSLLLAVMFQLGAGYTRIEFAQYFLGLFYFTALPWMLLAVLACFLQVISNNKYLGMLLFMGVILSGFALDQLGIKQHIFHYSQSPEWMYSDMNGYGEAIYSHAWYMLYWGAVAVLLSTLANGLWQRGLQQRLKPRCYQLVSYWGSKQKTILLISGLVFIGSAGVIYYNTRVINQYFTTQQLHQLHADYERQYSRYADEPIPDIIKIDTVVDIFPEQRKIDIDADLIIANKTSRPIERFIVTMPAYNPVMAAEQGYRQVDYSLSIEAGHLDSLEGPLNSHWFEFEKPMQPGEKRRGHYKITLQQRGFTDQNNQLPVLNNGTFIQNAEVFPRFGYQPFEALSNPIHRAEQGLSPSKPMPTLADDNYSQHSMLESILGLNTGKIEFTATLSTALDQIAIAPGVLQSEWVSGERRYFHYAMDTPIANYFAFWSGRYDVLESQHNGIDIAIYYHPDHSMNIEHMHQAIVDSLDYYSTVFSPYQHQQLRIIEFSGPNNFAQAFPNTIAYSEGSGFLHDLRKPESIDQVYYFTAHEVAHQWWGGQVDAANVQGATMLVETLAQYSALMLFKKKYGDHQLSQVLHHELDRYLRGRAQEPARELPLVWVENQPYIHYNKGAIAMLALADLLGEQRLNKALRQYLSIYKDNLTAYPSSQDLMRLIKQETTHAESASIERLFEEINLYDVQVVNAQVKVTDDGQFENTITIHASRYRVNDQGAELAEPLAENIDIGLYLDTPGLNTRQPQPVCLQKHFIKSGENTIKIITNEQPHTVIIDPMVKLIDRNIANNTLRF